MSALSTAPTRGTVSLMVTSWPTTLVRVAEGMLQRSIGAAPRSGSYDDVWSGPLGRDLTHCRALAARASQRQPRARGACVSKARCRQCYGGGRRLLRFL